VSEQNVEIVRQAFEAFNRDGDVEAVVATCDPAVEWFPPVELPSATAYQGHDGVRAAIQDLVDIFGSLRAEPEQLIDAGDHVVVVFRWGGHAKGSGLSLDQLGRQSVVFTMRNGKAIRVAWYLERSAALEAAGVTDGNADR
jgi:ketosteroid isomerase-like protein